jgi:hypothetical protein
MLDANQGEREALVLAVRGDKMLVEYEMPAGSTALRLLSVEGNDRGRPIPYRNVSVVWLKAIVEAGQTWTGKPQQAGGKTMPSPADLLKEKTNAGNLAVDDQETGR